MIHIMISRKDPQVTSESPPGGSKIQLRFSVSVETILRVISVMAYIAFDAADQALHLLSTILTSHLVTLILVNNHLQWLLTR